MNKRWKLYGVPMSYFSAKIRPVLRYKKIPFEEVWSTPEVYADVIIPRTGVSFIPVIVTDEDETLQDTPRMFERIEALHPDPPMLADDAVVNLLAHIIEDYADDALIPPAMHYRWGFPEQRPWIENDWATLMGPQSIEFAKKMSGILPFLGVTEKTVPGIESAWLRLLDILDEHLKNSRFLLGDRLGLADTAMSGPFYAHMGRDPVPARIMRERAPRVMAWLHEVNDVAPPSPWAGDFEIRETLLPFLREIGETFIPMQVVVGELVDEKAAGLEPGAELPRVFGVADQPVFGETESRLLSGYTVWRQRRTADRFEAMNAADRERVDALLGPTGVLPYVAAPPMSRFVMSDNKLKVAES